MCKIVHMHNGFRLALSFEKGTSFMSPLIGEVPQFSISLKPQQPRTKARLLSSGKKGKTSIISSQISKETSQRKNSRVKIIYSLTRNSKKIKLPIFSDIQKLFRYSVIIGSNRNCYFLLSSLPTTLLTCTVSFNSRTIV